MEPEDTTVQLRLQEDIRLMPWQQVNVPLMVDGALQSNRVLSIQSMLPDGLLWDTVLVETGECQGHTCVWHTLQNNSTSKEDSISLAAGQQGRLKID